MLKSRNNIFFETIKPVYNNIYRANKVPNKIQQRNVQFQDPKSEKKNIDISGSEIQKNEIKEVKLLIDEEKFLLPNRTFSVENESLKHTNNKDNQKNLNISQNTEIIKKIGNFYS